MRIPCLFPIRAFCVRGAGAGALRGVGSAAGSRRGRAGNVRVSYEPVCVLYSWQSAEPHNRFRYAMLDPLGQCRMHR
eukprot:6198477-Pleurochrysis_carterae.AAC.1